MKSRQIGKSRLPPATPKDGVFASRAARQRDRSLRANFPGGIEMPKVSRESAANKEVHGPVDDRSQDVEGGYTITFVSFAADVDGAPLLKGLPGDMCDCPHWGYVLKGTVGFRTATGEETYSAGDAFYIPPGHTPFCNADSEMLMFAPTKQLRVVEEVMVANFEKMMAGAR
jgi:hypothetical protein